MNTDDSQQPMDDQSSNSERFLDAENFSKFFEVDIFRIKTVSSS
jgi:hypothetical protein